MKHSILQMLLTESLYNKLGDYLIGTRLCEMAIERSMYKEKVENIIDQISQNAILVYIASHNEKYESLLNHWKTELNTHLTSIQRLQIKKDSREKRMNIINQVIDELDLGTREDAINAGTKLKMKKENISLNSQDYKNALYWLMNEYKTGNLSKIMTSSNTNDIDDYIDAI